LKLFYDRQKNFLKKTFHKLNEPNNSMS